MTIRDDVITMLHEYNRKLSTMSDATADLRIQRIIIKDVIIRLNRILSANPEEK